MALAALIAATRTVEDGTERLRAVLPLAGRTLVEHQARLAANAGAEQILILVERLPPALTAAVDRLRRDGLKVDIARSPADAADLVHPDEALLVIADGCLAAPRLVARVADARPPAVLTLPDHADNVAHERIDAMARWGGMLLIDGTRLRRTTEMLGEWDLELTLLRRVVQDGAMRLHAERDFLLMVEDEEGLDGFDRAMLAASRAAEGDWPARWLFPAIEQVAVPPLLSRGVDPLWLAGAGLATAAAAAVLAWTGWLLTAFGLLLLSGPLNAIASRLATTRLGLLRHARRFARVRTCMAIAALGGLSYALSPGRGWGVWVVTLLILLAMAGVAGQRTILGRLRGGAPLPWIATLDGLIWAMLPLALVGWWLGGLMLLAAYAVISAFALQREVLKRVAVHPAGEV